MKYFFIFNLWLAFIPLHSSAHDMQDLPPLAQVEAALENHIGVMAARSGVLIGAANRRKWSGGNHEFNIRAGSSNRTVTATGQMLREWDVSLERPVRLPNKVFIDGDIGEEGVKRADLALGDARHEAARVLLHLWFNWQREQAQTAQWRQQLDILTQQAGMTERRMRAGDAPKMELNLALAVVAQAGVSLQQASMRAQLAASELKRPFPGLVLPEQPSLAVPQAIEHDLDYWQQLVMSDNHELGMVQCESRIQALMARRNNADRIPDPTVGLRYSNEKEGEEKVAGLYVSIPFSFGLRGAGAEISRQQAEMANNLVASTRRRLEGDVFAVYTQAVTSYFIWLKAQEAAQSVRDNAELVARAYALGESSLADALNARRLALESALSASMAQLDANEARYRLLLDAHQLWSMENHDGEAQP